MSISMQVFDFTLTALAFREVSSDCAGLRALTLRDVTLRYDTRARAA
jgi:hypothetical protein